MKKYILLTISILFAGLASFAAPGDRFKYDGIWYEILDESAQTCQTAAAENIWLGMTQVPTDQWVDGKQVFQEVYGLLGEADSAIKNDDSKSWAYYQNPNCPIGPNWVTNIQLVEIPEFVYDDSETRYTVIRIGNFSFACQKPVNCTVKRFILPETIQEIGEGAFFGIEDLNYINLEEGLKSIGASAFENCRIQSLTIPASVEEICDRAFYNNNTMKDIEFIDSDPESQLTSIGNSAFAECSAIESEIRLPNKLETIGDYAFHNARSIGALYFGKNIKSIGKEAFYGIDMKPGDPFNQHSWIIPPTVTWIDFNAFYTDNKSDTFTDIYYANPNPTNLNNNAFGYVDEVGEVNQFQDDFWMYATVCLHVPVGTIKKYKECDGWKNFKCIIDDILPADPRTGESRSEDPMAYILDYIYLVPGDKVNLTKLLGDKANSFIWDENTGTDEDGKIIVQLDKDGNLEAKNYGNVVALATRTDIEKFDQQGNIIKEDDAIVGAVIVFVCPTITVVYDKEGLTDAESVTNPSNSRAQVRAKVDGDADANNEATQLQQSNTTYSHAVVFDSYPKVQVNPTGQIEIVSLERASLDSDNNYIDKEGLSEVENWDYEGSSAYPGAVLPDNPIKEDRMIVVNLAVPYGINTDNTPIEIDQKVSVITIGRTLKILGADDESEVRIVNIQGQNVYHGIAKVIDLEPGIYIITVEDAAFKAIVR